MNVDDTIGRTDRIERAVHTKRADETFAEAVVTALVEATNRRATEITPLYHSVDPDALEDLFGEQFEGDQRQPGCVSFTHDGYRVTIDGDDVIVSSLDT